MAELQNHDEQLMRAYLLGKLTETERLEVEQRYFTEDDFFLEISSLEEEMIRDFVRGELPAAEVPEFERRIAEAPDLARKVVEERALLAAVTGPIEVPVQRTPAPPVQAEPAPSVFDWLKDLFGSPKFAFSMATAGIAVALAATMYWGVQNRALRHELAQLRTSNRDLEVQLARATPPLIPYRLDAGQVRGERKEGSFSGPLSLGPSTRGSMVRLEVELTGTRQYPRYQATLRTLVGGVEVLTQDLAPGGGSVWVFTVPEVALRNERYRLDVQGVTENGVKEDLPSAPFTVFRPAP